MLPFRLSRPCGCPDCSKPHPVGWQKGYCNSYDSSSVSGDSSSSGGGDYSGDSYYIDSEGNRHDDGSTGGMQQGTRRSYYMWIAAGVVGSAAMAGAALAMRKRVRRTERFNLKNSHSGTAFSKTLMAAKAKNSSDEHTTAPSSDFSLMGTVGTLGAGAAIAGVMARLGMKGGSDGASVTSGSSGIVSRRMALLESDEPPPPVDTPSVAPSFIDIQSETESHWDESTVEMEEGVEIEGPFRPSQYGVGV